MKKERKYLKSENTVLKMSNDSNQFVIEQLNTALSKATGRIKSLEDRIGQHDILLFSQNGTPHGKKQLTEEGFNFDEFD